MPRDQLEDGTPARSIDSPAGPLALRLAKLSVNEALDRQGQTESVSMAFKNYMMTLSYRKERGSFGGNAATACERLERYNKSRD